MKKSRGRNLILPQGAIDFSVLLYLSEKLTPLPLWTDLLDLFYPRICAACEHTLHSREQYICLECRQALPRTRYHLQADNPVIKNFWGRCPVTAATAFLFFQKGGQVQKLMHNIKYKGQKEAARQAGLWFGQELNESALFQDVDFILPVPLHPSKQRSRGYNQSEWLGKGMAAGMQKQLSVNNLVRLQKSETQTKKSRIARWENVSDIFGVKQPEAFRGKHLLLIDDVITTGATLESCASILLRDCDNVRVSIATLAVATH